MVFDVSHPSALVITGEHPNPLDFDYGSLAIPVLTTTTHKTLRGARHALIITNHDEYIKSIRLACFPFLQGGQLVNMLAGVCATLEEASSQGFINYTKQIKNNMQALLNGIKEEDEEHKLRFVSGGSDNHLILIDVKKANLTGKEAETLLKQNHIECNMNTIPGDKDSKNPSGIRLGTPAITTRGFDTEMSYQLGQIVARILLKTDDFEDIAFEIQRFLDIIGPFYK